MQIELRKRLAFCLSGFAVGLVANWAVSPIVDRIVANHVAWVTIGAAVPVQPDQLMNDLGTANGSLVRVGVGDRGRFDLDAPENLEAEARIFLKGFALGKSYHVTQQ